MDRKHPDRINDLFKQDIKANSRKVTFGDPKYNSNRDSAKEKNTQSKPYLPDK
ncbi:hypothetical protein SOV_16870 [Sporomusa ovata DSM 2662]|uniref:Uncharacterized protein n=1 Tax=Sporomusa ovata TaxID=2378 RepID=A0A0U1KW19_9FIRM|nr:hypothetical protein [Sporomusa ovata]EQB29288.1 hypothetical protein SOV_1c10200 [Sporomusa ovata DSM 2662]CQR71329.1 hypothetical protein SpAn4DRAFT_3834 [Sporomusa ovata]